ncbi:hypothetical protein Tco_0539653 [Tanacetum coccineum]
MPSTSSLSLFMVCGVGGWLVTLVTLVTIFIHETIMASSDIKGAQSFQKGVSSSSQKERKSFTSFDDRLSKGSLANKAYQFPTSFHKFEASVGQSFGCFLTLGMNNDNEFATPLNRQLPRTIHAIAAHPSNPSQLAFGHSDSGVYVIVPLHQSSRSGA